MKKSTLFFVYVLASVFVLEGVIFIVGIRDSYLIKAYASVFYSAFIAFVHFFIAYGLIKQKRWAPHLGIFFQAYLLVNFLISNLQTLLSPMLFAPILTILSLSAFITTSLFVLRNQFTH